MPCLLARAPATQVLKNPKNTKLVSWEKIIVLRLPVGQTPLHDLPSIISAQTNQHDTDFSDGALGLEFHISFDRNDHVAVHKGALVSESPKQIRHDGDRRIKLQRKISLATIQIVGPTFLPEGAPSNCLLFSARNSQKRRRRAIANCHSLEVGDDVLIRVLALVRLDGESFVQIFCGAHDCRV